MNRSNQNRGGSNRSPFRNASISSTNSRISCSHSTLVSRITNPMLNRYQGVFKCLNSHNVKYLVIGGVAASVHGVARTTFDVDILIEPSIENARRLLAALEEAGFGAASLTTPEQLASHELTQFRDRHLLDVMTRSPGLEFQSAWERREKIPAGSAYCFLLSREDTVAPKRAAARPKDLDDVRALEQRKPPPTQT